MLRSTRPETAVCVRRMGDGRGDSGATQLTRKNDWPVPQMRGGNRSVPALSFESMGRESERAIRHPLPHDLDPSVSRAAGQQQGCDGRPGPCRTRTCTRGQLLTAIGLVGRAGGHPGCAVACYDPDAQAGGGFRHETAFDKRNHPRGAARPSRVTGIPVRTARGVVRRRGGSFRRYAGHGRRGMARSPAGSAAADQGSPVGGRGGQGGVRKRSGLRTGCRFDILERRLSSV